MKEELRSRCCSGSLLIVFFNVSSQVHRLTKSTPRVVLKDLPSKISHLNSKCAQGSHTHTHTHLQNSMYHPVLCKTNETFSENSRDRKCSCGPQSCRPKLFPRAPLGVATRKDWLARIAAVQPETILQSRLCSRRYSHRGVCRSQTMRRF